MKRRAALVPVAVLLMPALLQIAIGTQEEGWSNPFSGVSPDDPNFDGIRDAVQQGLMACTSAKTFWLVRILYADGSSCGLFKGILKMIDEVELH